MINLQDKRDAVAKRIVWLREELARETIRLEIVDELIEENTETVETEVYADNESVCVLNETL